jgi:uncharacterized protein YcbX
MLGRQVAEVRIDRSGIAGDRTWAVRDLERGGIRGAKVLGGLMRLSAQYVDGDDARGGQVEIGLPDGSAVRSDDPDVHERISAAIDHRVRLEPLHPADDLDHFRRGEPYHDDLLEDLRSIFGREPDEPLPDLSQFPPEIIEFESPPGTYHDARPLHLVTTSALRSLAEALPDSTIDDLRFRPSLVVDSDGLTGHPEKAWIGQRLAIGDAVIDVVSGCPRCVMVTRTIDDDHPQDRTILRHIVRDLGQDVGVYATVADPGEAGVGSTVELLGPTP